MEDDRDPADIPGHQRGPVVLPLQGFLGRLVVNGGCPGKEGEVQGAVAFGWLAVLLHDHDGPIDRRDVAGWAALATGLMCSGPAVTFIGVTTLTAALRRRPWRDTLLVGAVPALIFAAWWMVAGRHNTGQVARDGINDPWQIVDFAWTGITGTLNELVGIPQSGAVIILGIVVWWLRHPDHATGRASPEPRA